MGFPSLGRLTVLPVMDIKSLKRPNTKSHKNLSLHKDVGVTIANSKVSEVSPNPSRGRRQRPPRSWYFVLNAPSANAVNKFPSSVRSILSWEVTKNVRDRWSSFKNLVVNCPIHPEKNYIMFCAMYCQ